MPPLFGMEIVLEPKPIVLEFALFDDSVEVFTLYVEKSNDPFVTVIAVDTRVNALPKVHPQPTPLTVTVEAKETPLVVNVLPVLEPDSVIAPVYVRVKPVAGRVTSP